MITLKRKTLLVFLLAFAVVAACKKSENKTNSGTTGGSKTAPATKSASAETDTYEKHTPTPGTGSVQGRVMYNDQPVENIEVKLCEKFNTFSGCAGQTYVAKTAKNGEYIIKDVPPKEYEGLIARVFNTPSYVFLKSGFMTAAKYDVKADDTVKVEPTHLFKSDLKVGAPKAGSKVATKTPELKWDAYPDAAYYKFTLYPQDSKISAPYINERVDGTSFAVDKPMEKGVYRIAVEAYNANNRKLADCDDDIKFTIIAE